MMVASIRIILHSCSIILILLTAHSRCASPSIPNAFEIVLNKHVSYQMDWWENDQIVPPLPIEPVDVTTAQIERAPTMNTRPFAIVECVLRSAALTNFISPAFSDVRSLRLAGAGFDSVAASFPGADHILCVEFNYFQRGSHDHVLLYVEDDEQRLSLTLLDVEPMRNVKSDFNAAAKYTKVAVAEVPSVSRSKCRLTTRAGETLVLRQGRSWEAEVGVELERVECIRDSPTPDGEELWSYDGYF